MTAGIRHAAEKFTDTRIETCPWSSFNHDIVRRVLRAMPFFESGQLAFVEPDPSHRLVEAIAHYTSVDNRMRGRQLDMEREKQKAARRAAEAAQEMKRGR